MNTQDKNIIDLKARHAHFLAQVERLRAESIRLGGVPLLAVLAGLGWTRVNDTLGPVVRDTDGRVFTLSNLDEMLSVSPFPSLIGTATP